jgi:hypothetical protein
MGKFNGKDATVWMRTLRDHTYEGKPQTEGSIYLAHEEMVETIETLKMAVREKAPERAVRTPDMTHTTTAEDARSPVPDAPVPPAPVVETPAPTVTVGFTSTDQLLKGTKSKRR